MPSETTSNELRDYCLTTESALSQYHTPLQNAFNAIFESYEQNPVDMQTVIRLGETSGYFKNHLRAVRNILKDLADNKKEQKGCDASRIVFLTSELGEYLATMRRKIAPLSGEAPQNSKEYLNDIEARLPDMAAQLLRMGALSNAEEAEEAAEEISKTFRLHHHAIRATKSPELSATEDTRKALWLHDEALKVLRSLDGVAERKPGDIYATAKATGLPLEQSTSGFLLLREMLAEMQNGRLDRPSKKLVGKITKDIIEELHMQMKRKPGAKNSESMKTVTNLADLLADLEDNGLAMTSRIKKSLGRELQL